jgi:hypothetical protein
MPHLNRPVNLPPENDLHNTLPTRGTITLLYCITNYYCNVPPTTARSTPALSLTTTPYYTTVPPLLTTLTHYHYYLNTSCNSIVYAPSEPPCCRLAPLCTITHYYSILHYNTTTTNYYSYTLSLLQYLNTLCNSIVYAPSELPCCVDLPPENDLHNTLPGTTTYTLYYYCNVPLTTACTTAALSLTTTLPPPLLTTLTHYHYYLDTCRT